MAKDAITMFKEAAAQLQREEAYLALEGTRKKNDEDEALQQLIGDFNLARIDLNSELSKSADKDQDKVNELNAEGEPAVQRHHGKREHGRLQRGKG